jgi:hypothetical protein
MFQLGGVEFSPSGNAEKKKLDSQSLWIPGMDEDIL